MGKKKKICGSKTKKAVKLVKCTGAINNLENLIVKTEETLTKANHYSLRNGLMINPNKTQCIFTGNRQLLSRIPNKTTIKLRPLH